MEQKHTSENTSINTITKVYNQIQFESGTILLDYGGGKYDTNTEYLADMGIRCLVYDPYNRSEEHNKIVIDFIEDIEGADYIVCANVLNVIEEDEIILDILEHIKSLIHEDGKIYIQIYESDKSGQGEVTTKGYQRNQRTITYRSLIQEVFIKRDWTISRKSNIFEVRPNR